jgi:large subunit ribosomal protein L15
MMEHEVAPPKGARRKRKRLGRGDASGHGSYSGRGMKGAKSRSGPGPRPGYEGGQMPLIKGLPMRRGFTNIFKKQYCLVKLDSLNSLPPASEVTPDVMVRMGVIKNLKLPVKVLGNGDLQVPLTVYAQRFTHSAREKIEASGGRAEVI